MIARVALLLSLAWLAGCADRPSRATEPTACERMGQPCRMPDGPMGICNESTAVECASPPCLACISQH